MQLLTIFSYYPGAPEGFCKQHAIKHKPLTHLFAVEGDDSAFFSCNQLGEATQCLSCPAGLVFNEVCQGCRRYKTGKCEKGSRLKLKNQSMLKL